MVEKFLKVVGDKSMSGLRLSASINYTDALKSRQPNLLYVSKDNDLADMVGAVAYELVKEYIEINYSGTNAPLVAKDFITFIFSNYYTWNAVDFQSFVNFIKLNKPETIGHKISTTELMESVKQYESVKAEEYEKIIHNKKYQHQKESEAIPEENSPLKALIKKLEDKEKKKQDDVNEKVVAAKKVQDIKNKKWNELEELVVNEELTFEEMMIQWNTFLKQLRATNF